MTSRLPPDPVIYQIYVRSFADSDGDGIGDLSGIICHLDYLADLGVDGIWLTPIFESPQLDYGYDVSDYCKIHSEYGSLADLDRLIEAMHRRGLAIILDMILAHTSIEHPWFRSHPDRYVWADQRPNNWLSVFGGSAWEFDKERERFYYHRFYREQPNLNWNNPDVREAMHRILAFWIERGVDGFRLDALDGLAVDPRLRSEPPADPAKLAGRHKDSWADYWSLDHVYTCNRPEVLEELARLSAAFQQTAFVVEADLPSEQLRPYMELADSSFAFDFLRAPPDGLVLRQVITDIARHGSPAWALSNHDQPRVATRWGRDLAGVAAVALLSLPGWSFIYQGEEIGMVNGHGSPVVHDRSGRDAVRHPMQWTAAGGFTAGVPWLPMVDPEICNVEDQLGAAGSMVEQYRALIRIRRQLSGQVSVVAADTDFLSFARDDVIVALNLGDSAREITDAEEVLYSSRPRDNQHLPPRSAMMYTRKVSPCGSSLAATAARGLRRAP